MTAQLIGRFIVELDLEAGTLAVTIPDTQVVLHIGGDAVDVLDWDLNHLERLEL